MSERKEGRVWHCNIYSSFGGSNCFIEVCEWTLLPPTLDFIVYNSAEALL